MYINILSSPRTAQDAANRSGWKQKIRAAHPAVLWDWVERRKSTAHVIKFINAAVQIPTRARNTARKNFYLTIVNIPTLRKSILSYCLKTHKFG